MSPAVIALVASLLLLGVIVAALAVTQGLPRLGTSTRLPVSAPWLLVTAVLLLVGIFVVPKLFGFTFLFLPFIFSRAARRNGPRGMPPPTTPDDPWRDTDER